MSIRKSIATLIAFAAFWSIMAAPVWPLDKATCMLDWYPNPDHVPIYLARTEGHFAEQGLDVDIMVPADPNDPLKLVAAGKVDFAVSYQPSVIIASDRGLPLVSIGALVQHPLSCLLYLKDSGIQKVADLKGRRIGYSVEPLYRVLFEAVAEAVGLKSTDYQLFRVGYNLSPPLLSGQVDAVIGAFRNYEAIQIELQGRAVGIFPLEEHGIPDFYELIIIAHPRLIRENPEKASAFMTGLTKGIHQTLQEPETSFNAFVKHLPELADELNRRSFEVTRPFFQGSPAQDTSRWEKMQAFMLHYGLIQQAVPIRDLVWPGR